MYFIHTTIRTERNEVFINLEKKRNFLNAMIGKRICSISREGGLVSFGFGDLMLSFHYDQNIMPEFVLHFMCPFRIEMNEKIILGDNDLYIPSDRKSYPVNLDIQNSTMFDKIAGAFIYELNTQEIEEINLTSNGDISIIFGAGAINSFICASEGEAWRFFKTQTNEQHLVASCGNIEFQ